MIRGALTVSLLLAPAALAAASPPSTPRPPSSYGLSTLATQTRGDQRVCLVEKKARHLVCQSRDAWRRLARRMEAEAANGG
jgi:hypothetical protein